MAQFNVAAMYRNGQGAEQSDIHAYAWAMLAAQNGDARAKSMAGAIRPQLAPGSEQIAGTAGDV
ncbi:MAG TPA: SEL1-like repeat protein [Steroidobacteraceae bacterium]